LADKILTDCGSSIGSTGAAAASSDCSMTCSGNSTETCGGPNRVSIFWNGKNPPPGASTGPGTLGYEFYGCYTYVYLPLDTKAGGCILHEHGLTIIYREGTNGRALTTFTSVTGGSSAMSVALCIQACNSTGFSMAGVEYADECCKFIIYHYLSSR
jgi:hypothetical protein